MRNIVAVVATFSILVAAVTITVFSQSQTSDQNRFVEKKSSKKDDISAEKIPVPSGPYSHPEKFSLRPSKSISKDEVERLKLALHKASYFKPLSDKSVQCLLCPRHCLIKDGERGACRIRANYDGTLYALTYGKPVAINNDPVEKKPLNHFLPGTKSLSIATIGCNFGCIFCQNWHISQEYPERGEHLFIVEYFARLIPGKSDLTVFTPSELVQLAKLLGADSISYTYTEPSVFYEYMLDTAKEARKAGVKNIWVTCGYLEEKPLRELCKYLDAANVDLKGFSEEFYSRYCGSNLAPVLKTLKILKEENVWLEITNLVIPGANDSDEMIRKMCVWLKENLGTDVPLHFSRFYPNYKLQDRPETPFSTLQRAAKIAKEEGIKYVYIGNVWAEGVEDTLCPDCGKRLVRRRLMSVLENHIKDGKCEFCKTSIPGVWSLNSSK
ncbi:MAG: AmmeMemoRadiSam system radical SAM enzyme [Planctomycetota bacterium]|nr:AmmeMemoRadiSam system radical SAM enzyme [Planctomycetota bacterium]